MQKFNIRVHYPTTKEGMDELEERVSQMKADAIVMYVNNQELTKTQKLELLDKILENVE